MFGSNKLYTGFTNLNESISNESNENFLSLSPTKIKKSSIKSFDNYKRKSVQILEKTDENDIIIHLSQGESIEMIIYNEKTKEYEFTSNASETFMKYNGFCSCVSIFGEKYSGKSYLMNSIIGVKEGFNINHDKENEHFCIYLYTEPYFYEKENLYIFFIDTSKLGEINPENFPQNSTLFSILNLISSFMMINCFGDMIPSNLKHMVYATSLHENISLVNEEKDSEYKNDYLPYYLPPILWVFRDYQPESIKICKFQQFQNFLNDQKTKNKIYNQIKQFIAELYKDIDFIMACKIPDSNANEEKQWRDFVITIRKKILQKISPKIINGIKFNCRMFSSFIHSVIEELNENCVPNINNALEYIIENECILGYNEAIDQYLNSLKVTFDNDELKSMFCLTNILKEIRDKTMEIFYSYAIFCEKTKYYTFYKKKLKTFLDEKEKIAFQNNEILSEEVSLSEYQKNFVPIKNSLNNGNLNLENYYNFINEFNNALDKFNIQSFGDKKLKVLHENIVDFQENIFSYFSTLLQSHLSKKKLDDEIQKLKKLYEEKDKDQIRNMNGLDIACKKTEEKNKDVENELNNVKEIYRKYQKELEDFQKTNEVLNEQLRNGKKIYDIRQAKINTLNIKKQELAEERFKNSQKKKCCGK